MFLYSKLSKYIILSDLKPRSTVSGVVEVTDVDGPNCDAHNRYHLQ